MIKAKNIFLDISKNSKEQLGEILSSPGIRIERIVSPAGFSNPDGFWYDQNENELVLLLKGEAELLFENGSQIVKMRKGDYINIPAHVKHRVESTHYRAIWLCIFY